MILWIVLGAMSVIAAALIMLPLLSGGRGTVSRAAHEMEIYRDQLDEVGRDFDRGLISPDQAEAARTEISRRILALDAADTAHSSQQPGTHAGETAAVPPGATGGRKPVSVLSAIAAGIAVPALAAFVYLSYGSPGLPGLPAAERTAAATAPDGELRTRVAALAARLEQNPDDLESWSALGDTLTALQRHPQAAVAYGQAMRLAPRSGGFASRYAEALTFSNRGQVTPAARLAFEEALRREPGEPRAQFYLGMADRQSGKLREALDRWIALESASAPDAPWIKFLTPRIAALAGELSLDLATLADMRARAVAAQPRTAEQRPSASASTSAPGPTRDQVEAAQDMTAEDRQQMIRGMVDRLAARLDETPDDIDGWLRLARARAVLGDHQEASAAYQRAATLRPNDMTVLVAWADSIVATTAPAAPDPAQLGPVVERILARDDTHPRGLWLSGALALSAGDRATAFTQWTKLLEFVDPNSVQYIELKKQLDALRP